VPGDRAVAGLTPEAEKVEINSFDRMMRSTATWIEKLNLVPGWEEWQKSRVECVALYDLADLWEQGLDFPLPAELEVQHSAIMSYLSMSVSLAAVSDCEYYFRRYPFKGLPVGRREHLRYTCENYFSRIYEFGERMKRCLNAVNSTLSIGKIDIKGILKSFDAEFKDELRARNRIHHHDSFDDVLFDKMFLTGVMADVGNRDIWQREMRRTYRRFGSEWAQRVRKRANRVAIYRDAVGEAMLTNCSYLQDS